MEGKFLYKIGEVADILGESVSLVRFWANEFSAFIHPQRNAKGNRLFTSEDLQTMKTIRFLVKRQGLTLEGAARKLKADRKKTPSRMKVVEALEEIREQLLEIRSSL